MAATHTGATIRISDLVPVGGELSDTTFIECAIHGPAILFSEGTDGITWRGTNNFNARTSAAILWPIDDDRESVTGLLHLTRCVFQDCTFQNVGLAARNLQEAGDAVRKAGPAGWNGHH